MNIIRDTVMKKIIKIIITCSILFSFSMAAEEAVHLSFNDSASVIAYQQNKNRETQHLLDRVYGVERVMVDIKVNVIKKEEVLSQPTNLLLPGVPNQIIEPPRVGTVYYLTGYDISIWIAPDVRDQNTVEEMIKDVMEFNKYPQSTIVTNRAIDKINKPSDLFTQETINGIKEIINTINISIRLPEIGAVISAAVSSNSSLNASMKSQMDINNLIVIIIGFLVIMIVVVLLIVVFTRPKKETAVVGAGKSGDGETASSTAAAGGAAAGAQGGVGGMGSDFSLDVSHKQATDDEEISGHTKSELFTFVDESNIFKLAFILQQEKPKGKTAEMDEYWQNVAIIVSFLPSHLSRIIFMKYSIEEQSEIIPYLAYEIDYPIEQIQELEKQFNEKLANLVLVGGKRSVMPILDKFSNQKKSELAKQLSEKHPDVLTEIRDMIILFEDLTLLPKDSLTKLLMEVDPSILALCFINMPEDERNDIFSDLAEGLRAMINEVIDLRKDNYTEVEVQDATDTLIAQAKALNRKGIIKLNLTGFGDQEGTTSQLEIDKLFEDDN
ncbi:MAG: FliG C-terminal domain-containing protein [Candidatus Margulisbacteria bacterium]|nr:FliG C-terminal domain-containing protein [Candidatus Margulisiibacteriota bacterium]